MACKASPNCKVIILMILVSWTIWKGQNARVFRKKQEPPTILLELIKREARLWVAVGAKLLSIVIMGE
jgi:hypothetical protein